jgi:hypothetical protein
VFSATYRTTKPYEQFKKANRYIVTKLRLPDIGEGDVTLTRKDVLDQMVYDFDVFFSQSGCVNGSEIYYVFGHGKPPGEVGDNHLRTYSLKTRTITRRVDLTADILDEPEGIAFYQGDLYLMTQKATLYKIKL